MFLLKTNSAIEFHNIFRVMAKEGRPLIQIIIRNFLNSFRPRQIRGDLKGEDYFGNKYYEIPADPSRGKRKPSRWFEPPGKPEDDHGH